MIKTTFFVVSIFIFLSVPAFCQYSFLGYKGGYNFSSFKEGFEVSEEDSSTGIALGLSVTSMLEKKYGFTLECLYCMMGGIIPADANSSGNDTYMLNLPYLMVPVLFKYYLNDRVFFSYVGGGAYISYLPGASYAIGDAAPLEIIDYEDLFKRTTTGFILTGGIDMIFDAGGILTAEARIYLGNDKIIQKGTDISAFPSTLMDLENYSLSFYLGFANGFSFEHFLEIILTSMENS